ncbi:MAG: Ig-like domain-containing protein [Clostridiales bacterium]|nr:Ig-like domain-containing protein [Clostridiales bacterium]
MKKIQKTCAVALAFSMVLTSAAITPSNDAAAAKLKISKKKATLTVGKTLKLKVTGAKKAKWSSSNSRVASVSQKGVVKAKSVGTAKITAKVKSKKVTCKVSVKSKKTSAKTNPSANLPSAVPVVVTPAPTPVVTQAPAVENNTNTISASTLAENLGVVTQQLSDGSILFTVTNNNSVAVPYYSLNYQLKNSAGVVCATSEVSGSAINPGTSQYLVGTTVDSVIDPSKSIISKVAKTDYSYVDASDKVSITQNSSDDEDKISFTCTSTELDISANIVILFYDASGKVVGSKTSYESFYDALTIFDYVYAPDDPVTYDNISYSSVKFFVYGKKYVD